MVWSQYWNNIVPIYEINSNSTINLINGLVPILKQYCTNIWNTFNLNSTLNLIMVWSQYWNNIFPIYVKHSNSAINLINGLAPILKQYCPNICKAFKLNSTINLINGLVPILKQYCPNIWNTFKLNYKSDKWLTQLARQYMIFIV